MKRSIIILIVSIIILLPACSSVDGNADISSPPSNSKLLKKLTPDIREQNIYQDIVFDEYPNRYSLLNTFIKVETDYYSLSLPKGWRLDDGAFTKIYNVNNEIVGEIFTRSLDTESNILGNHAELLVGQEINEGGLHNLSLIYASDYPAASGIDRITIKQAVIFQDKSRPDACFLVFNKAYLENNCMHYGMLTKTIIKIAKTFVTKVQ